MIVRFKQVRQGFHLSECGIRLMAGDPVAALASIPLIIREGLEGLRGEAD